jgi:phosphoserine phosphatase
MSGRPRFGTVVFDCDATLSAITGIEELSREQRSEVERLTDSAMGGQLPLEQIYARRLALARPNRARVEDLGRLYVERLVPDAREVVAALSENQVDVRIVSSGVRPAVLALARELDVADDHVAAVDIQFDAAGEYDGFDPRSPLVASGGKLLVLERWGRELKRPVMMVGDGMTDLETRPMVDLFVAFAGVSARPAVMAGADVVIKDFSLAPVLSLALDRPPEHEPARSLYERGLSMLEFNRRNDA